MAVSHAVPVNELEERAELESVLRSEAFLRAPRLAQLLTYLCERRFAGEAHLVKEYSIGVEVFHRGEGFDQDSDSIVRVEANRLRKRLGEYYAGEGAAHAIQITIPVGQYVPDFQRKAAALPPNPEPLAQPPSGKKNRWLLAIPAALLVLAVAYGLIVFLRPARNSAPPAATPPLNLADEMQVGLPAGEEVRILCGAAHALVDHTGKLWSADAGFTGGSAVKSAVQHIWRTQEPAFYRTSRQGDFRYDLPLKPGIYELRLHFAETEYGPESTGTGGEGNRIMSVHANGKPLLTGFDVAADAGASRTADVKVFTDVSPAKDGMLHLAFAGEQGRQAILSAIEIVPGQRGRIRPVRILPRQSPYYSNDSQWWSPDAFFEGGQLASYAAPVTGTDDPELYTSERWGNFSYAIPVTAGMYVVTLRFAARHGDWPMSAGGGASAAHVFNVFCNGKVLLSNFDLAREAKQSDVVTRRAAGLQPNAQGKLLLAFVPVQGYASVSGIEVVPQ